MSSFLDNVRKIPGLGGIPGGAVELESVEREKARAKAIAEREIAVRREKGLDYADLVEPEDTFGFGDLMTRVLALTLTGLGIVAFIIGTYFWTQMTAGNIGPLGYAMTPIGMYGILIILIPMMGIIHSLWTSSDVKRRKAESLRAARDKLRVSLLATNDNVTNNVRSAPMPSSMLFGESEEDLRRRRREQQQGRGG